MSRSCPVYRAEWAAEEACPVLKTPVTDPQGFANWISRAQVFRDVRRQIGGYPDGDVSVAYGDVSMGCLGVAYADLQHIDLRPGHLPTVLTMLHELAHLCLPEGESHTPRFAAVVLSLVGLVLGEQTRLVLTRCYRSEGVL